MNAREPEFDFILDVIIILDGRTLAACFCYNLIFHIR